jgi:hypothetical protein
MEVPSGTSEPPEVLLYVIINEGRITIRLRKV